jgi:uncharacterized protein involved in outer membrane biogenesis
MSFTLDGALDEVPMTAEGSIGEGSSDVLVEVAAAVAGATIGIAGTIGDADAMTGLKFNLEAAGDSLSDLAALGLDGLPPLGAYRLKGTLSDNGSSYTISDLDAQVGNSDLKGTMTFTEADRPRVDATLNAQSLDLDALLADGDSSNEVEDTSGRDDAASQDGAPSGEAPAPAEDAELLFPDEPFALDGLDELDAAIKLTAAAATYRGLTLTDLAIGLEMVNGVLSITPLDAGIAGGTMAGTLALDSRAEPPALQTTLQLRRVDLAALKSLVDVTEVASGPVDLDVALTGRGRSPHAIASSLDGRIDLVVGKGQLHNEYIDLIAADLLGYLIPGVAAGEGDAATLNCFVARFALADGIATNDGLLLDTALTTTAGDGQIDLRTETAQITVVPRPKDESLLSLAIPVVVSGPLTDLSYDLKREDALLGAAGAILGTAILGPFGILIPLVSTGTGDENPCVAALDQPAEAATPAESTTGGVAEKAGNVVDGAGEVVEGVVEGAGDAAGEAADVIEDAVDDLFDVFD